MNKDNILFGIIGLLAGLIIGFIATNSYNRNTLGSPNLAPTNPMTQNQPNSTAPNQPNQTAAMPAVAEAIDKADKDPNNVEAQVKAGEMFARINNYEKAIPYFEKANQIKPNDYSILVMLGNINFDSRKWEDAQKWYEKALSIKKDDIAVRTDLGITFVERSTPDYDRAIKEFQTSLTIDPKHEPTLYNLALANYKKGNIQEAQAIRAKLASNTELSKKLDALFASN